MAETTKERLNKQFAQLESERQSFEPHWRELSDYINPRGSRFLTSEVNRNDRRNTRIIDSTGTMAARTLASGMMSGITSPARPWFRLATPDPEMMDYGPVKLWLEAVQNRMNDMFNKSNLYQSLPQLYGSLGTYSTGAMAVLEDDEDIIRTMPFPIGSYYLANSPRGSVDTCFRKFSMTVRQLVQEFGLNNVSESVKSMWESGTYEKWIDVMHSVYPNIDRDTLKLDSKNKPFKSVYYEVGGDNDKLLRESGFTSPARPWFRLATPDPEMMDYGPVKLWLEAVQNRMNDMFNKSNLYQSLPQLYGSLGTYSTGAMAVLEDDEDIIRTMPFPIGSYYLANSPRGSVDTCFRKFSMTVRQLVQEFGLNNVSESVKSMWESGTYEKWIDVMHSVYPNIDRDTLKLDSKNKPFKSVYYEVGGDNDKLLRESGFDEFPIMAPRWEVNGEDVYGSSCPGMLALGPVKALQLLQKRKSQLIDKATNPPMVAPTSLKNQRASLLPGDITYIDQITGQDGFRPAYLVNPSTADLVADIQDTRQIINSAYFVDLFMMLQNINTRSMPVEAVIEMKEEKLLMLGPVLERLNDECLNPLIDRAFSMMVRKNMLPPPPDAMEGMPLKVEYISVMAQAQKSIGLSSLASTVNFIGQLAQAKPEALDKLNVDQAIDAFADMSGVSPTVIVPQEQVEQARQQRAQQQQQQQMMAMGMAAAQGAKTLSEAKTSDPSVLSAMANAVSGQGGQSQ
ncbi:head-to-tail connector protein [Escherichia phage vB_EcoP_PAS61]|uniref:Head-to-tail connector protein n=31 Tax=root TaxID=1 RepID=A0AA51VIP0_9CAUD|nr:head-to-tail connector protein [Escherichia phage vB_EcoP_PAS61]